MSAPSSHSPRRVAVLGSTGSIGTSTLDVIERLEGFLLPREGVVEHQGFGFGHRQYQDFEGICGVLAKQYTIASDRIQSFRTPDHGAQCRDPQPPRVHTFQKGVTYALTDGKFSAFLIGRLRDGFSPTVPSRVCAGRSISDRRFFVPSLRFSGLFWHSRYFVREGSITFYDKIATNSGFVQFYIRKLLTYRPLDHISAMKVAEWTPVNDAAEETWLPR